MTERQPRAHHRRRPSNWRLAAIGLAATAVVLSIAGYKHALDLVVLSLLAGMQAR